MPPPPFPASVHRIWRLRIRDAWVEVPLLPHHCLDAGHQGLPLPRAGPPSHGGDNTTLIQTLPDSQGLGGVQVMMLHKVTQDLLVLVREAVRQPWFLPGGIEQRVPGLPRPYRLTQQPDRCTTCGCARWAVCSHKQWSPCHRRCHHLAPCQSSPGLVPRQGCRHLAASCPIHG